MAVKRCNESCSSVRVSAWEGVMEVVSVEGAFLKNDAMLGVDAWVDFD